MSRAQQLITENIATWTGAIQAKSASGRGSSNKYELYGIKKLRELILELAVRGKLVPQDSSDEPASVLLERIAAEKAELIKAKKIKKSKALPPISDEEKPFELPEGWVWARYGNITNIGTGKLDANAAIDGGKYPFFTCSRTPSKIDTFSYDCSAVLLAGNGDFNIKYYSGKFDAYQRTYIIEPLLISLKFLYYLTKSQIERITENQRGSAIPYLKLGDLTHPVMGLPPLNEQSRIVQKVDELMTLCDQLEQQTESSIEAHGTLVDTLLSTLTNSADADELQQNWARIAGHFDTLFTTEQSIDALKQTILQLAVMGKLVRQNPNDEPAAVLLERIAAEKDRLVKEKKFKKEKVVPPISDDEREFELPNGWEWCRVGEISLLKGGFAYKSQAFLDDGKHQVIRMGNIRPDDLRLDEKKAFIHPEMANSTDEYRIESGDILLTMTGTKGKIDYLYSVAISDFHLRRRQLYLNQRLCRIRSIGVCVDFVNKALKDSRLLVSIFRKSTGTANQANIGMEAIYNWVLPLPPLAEQHRIVAKVDELMTLCDKLKDKLRHSQQTQVHLTDAIVEQALA